MWMIADFRYNTIIHIWRRIGTERVQGGEYYSRACRETTCILHQMCTRKSDRRIELETTSLSEHLHGTLAPGPSPHIVRQLANKFLHAQHQRIAGKLVVAVFKLHSSVAVMSAQNDRRVLS